MKKFIYFLLGSLFYFAAADTRAATECTGGSCDGQIMENGEFSVNKDETVDNATINSDGILNVNDGGTATDTVVNEGGIIYVNEKGTAQNTTVNNGGAVMGTPDSKIDGLTLEEGAHFSFHDFDGSLSVTNATQDGKEISIQGGVATGLTINDGSYLESKQGEDLVVDGGAAKLDNMRDSVVKNVSEKNALYFKNDFADLTLSSEEYKNKKYMLEKLSQKYDSGTITEEEKLLGNQLFDELTDLDSAVKLFDDQNLVNQNFHVQYGDNLQISADNSKNAIGLPETRQVFEARMKIYRTGGSVPFNKLDSDISLYELLTSIRDKYPVSDLASGFLNGAPNLLATMPDHSFLNGASNVLLIENLKNSSVSGFGIGSQYMENVDLNEGAFVFSDTLSYRLASANFNNVRFNEGSGFILSTLDEVQNSVQEGKEVSIKDNVADGWTVNKDSMLVVFDDGTAQNITVNDGGMLMADIEKPEPDARIIAPESKAVLDHITFNKGGQFDLDTDVTLTNSTQDGKAVSIKDNVAEGLTVTDGSTLIVNAYDTANNTVVDEGGRLTALKEAQINNMIANGGAILNIDATAVLTGDIVVDKMADTSLSSYDFAALFAAMNKDAETLTLTGGVNDAFSGKVINEDTDKDKSLTLANGEYTIANTATDIAAEVSGWDVINIEAQQGDDALETVVKLESDIALQGSNKNLVIGENAVLDVSGHSPLEISIDGNVINDGMIDFTVHDGNGEADDITTITGDYTAKDGAKIALNIEPENLKADKLVVEGDVSGNTSVYLKTSSEAEATDDILFAEVPNDNPDTASSFDIWRVDGSPYKWDTKFEDNKWYTYVSGLDDGGDDNTPGGGDDGDDNTPGGGDDGDDNNPGGNGGHEPILVPEIIAYAGLYDAGFEQTRSLARAINANSGRNGWLGRGCRYGQCASLKPLHTAWAVPVYANINAKAPYDYDASISGLDAGIDLAANGISKIGIMASYRKGSYDFSGRSDKFFSDTGSEIDIDSYLLGMYVRHDRGNFKAMAAAFGGIQKADIRSDDGVKADTDGIEAGVTLDVAYIYEAVKDVTLEPELQISYTMLKYDDIKDNAGKKVELKTAHRVEAEAGVKLKKSWQLEDGKAAIYVKPGLVQTFNGGGKIAFARDSADTLDDQTLGRAEIGADFQIDSRWSAGVSAAYTFNGDYEDTTFNLDLQYRF